MMRNGSRRGAMLACVLLLVSTPALAYVDPGSGMLFWQGFIAFVGAVAIFFRNIRQYLKRVYRKIFKSARSER
jgi:hypothetical protein